MFPVLVDCRAFLVTLVFFINKGLKCLLFLTFGTPGAMIIM